jgi:hypothetical protein
MIKMINEQFDEVYKNDKELRDLLGKEAKGLSIEDKAQIL